MNSPVPSAPVTNRSRSLGKAIVLLTLGAVLAAVFVEYREQLSIESLARQQATLERWRVDTPALVYGGGFVVYVLVAAFALPIAAPLTLLYGWYFPFWQAVLIVSFASTTGATLSFLMSRVLFRDALQARFAEKLTTFNAALEREGAFYLFSLRLIPAVPFWMLNLLMGLTPIRAVTFYWVSQLGMLPGTVVYLYAGSQLPDLTALQERQSTSVLSPGLLVAFAILALFPLITRRVVQRFRDRRA